ncbi:MAG: fumarylacetoacetate hydrolase family protein [Candidatus Hydrogenedentes bacterium]|nr:fumarylacetoacetate hydrolase family protein [Candidatus Hydrogenedentota bacterium]
MQFGRVLWNGTPVIAAPLGDRWFNFTVAAARALPKDGLPFSDGIRDVGDLIRSGRFTPETYRRVADRMEGRDAFEDCWFPGVPAFTLPWRPGKVIAIGRNYAAHVAEFDNQLPEEPVFFSKANSACIGPGEPVRFDASLGRVDHEGELGVVIGRRACRVSEKDAMAHVAGYTLVNDVTARDMQRAAMAEGNPWFCAKSVDTFCPLGPVVAMPELFSEPVETPLEVRVNGETRQQSDTGRLIFGIPRLIAAVSRFITLEPGDLISTGTPEGVSALKDGDEMEVLNPVLGVLANPVRVAADR